MDVGFTRNKWMFGLGTVGRDMFYSMVSMYMIYYISNVLSLPVATFAAVTAVLTVLRIFDALNDPLMGLVVDNTVSRWGKFKPGMLLGAVTGAIFMLLMFSDLGLTGATYVIVFGVCYLAWDVTYGVNDIAYWSMMPALTLDQKEREKLGAFARICANIGMYIVVVGIEPVTASMGNTPSAWFLVAIVVAALMLGFQLFTLLGVREPRGTFGAEEKTTLKQMFRAIVQNDQLLWTTVSMALFMIGYSTTTSFGLYYMQYIFGDKGMYAVFAGILGVAQLLALFIFPLFSKRFTRKQLYLGATVLVLAGYVIFFLAPKGSIAVVGAGGALIFIGQAFIQLLMLMFLADTIEYGQWKLGKRNESVTFSIQPLINKIGGAIATGIVSVTLVLSGIKTGDVAAESIPADGQLILKLAMLVLPLIAIVVGYFVYLKKYRIDPEMYASMLADLRERGEIKDAEQNCSQS